MGDYACLEAVINAGSVSSLQLDCGSKYSCEAMTVNVGNDADVVINCDGTDTSCKDLILNAQSAGNTVINCYGRQACSGMMINCGNGDCKVNCIEGSGNVCYGLALVCGDGQCAIDCKGPTDKCLSINVDPSNAQKFECTGSAQDCSYAPSPFTIPTPIPTQNPSASPSFMPSLPTSSPTMKPTKPTFNPSKSPSLVPSVSPTPKPSSSPIIKILTTFSLDADTTTTLKPSSTKSASSNIIPSTTTTMTTTYSTVNQLDASICCECLQPATNENRIKGCSIDPQCQQIICDFDNYCCETLWDRTCTFYASEQCEKSIETTQELAIEQQQPAIATDFNLVWKFALVVLAVMVLIITCCFMCIHIHKSCKRWNQRTNKSNERKQAKQIKQNQQIKRSKSEIPVPSKKENEGKKVVRIKTSISHRGHQRMRSTDNYALRYEHKPIGTNMAEDDLDDIESDDLKHDDLNDVCLGMRIQKNGKQFGLDNGQRFIMDDSLSNSESTSPNDEFYKKKKRKKKGSKKKKKRKQKKRKSKRRKRKRNTNVDMDDSTTRSSDNDDAGTEIMLKLQRSFSHSMLKRHSI